MVGIGGIELVFLILITAGGQITDVASLLDTEDYFRARQVDVSIGKMLELAQVEPTSGRSQIMQLLALRYLAEHADEVKKDAAARQTLAAIARGEKASDPQGFAQAAASIVLQRLAGEQPKAHDRKELLAGLSWFPGSSSLVGVVDFRTFHAAPGTALPALRAAAFKKLPKQEKDKLYSFLEDVGNVRVDRLAFAIERSGNEFRVLVRSTGKLNRARVLAKVRSELKDRIQVDEKGDIVVVSVHSDPDGPALALIGDEEVVLAAGPDKNLAHLQRALEVRMKKAANVTAGELKTQLARVSPKASAVVLGSLPEAVVPPLPALPRQILKQVIYGPLGLDVDIQGSFAGADEAKKFVEGVVKLRATGQDTIKALRDKVPPQFPLVQLERLLESMQIEAQGDQVLFRVHVSRELIEALPRVLLQS